MHEDGGVSKFTLKYTEANSAGVTIAMACVLNQICCVNKKPFDQTENGSAETTPESSPLESPSESQESQSQLVPSGKKGNGSRRRNPFVGSRHLDISILDYCQRVRKYTNCSPSCFVLAVMYIDRLIQKRAYIVINSLTIHRLIIVSVVIALKFWDDSFYPNSFYAKVGGLSCPEFNRLEAFFLFALNFDLSVQASDFDQYLKFLVNHVADARCTQPVCISTHTNILLESSASKANRIEEECATPKSCPQGVARKKRKTDSWGSCTNKRSRSSLPDLPSLAPAQLCSASCCSAPAVPLPLASPACLCSDCVSSCALPAYTTSAPCFPPTNEYAPSYPAQSFPSYPCAYAQPPPCAPSCTVCAAGRAPPQLAAPLAPPLAPLAPVINPVTGPASAALSAPPAVLTAAPAPLADLPSGGPLPMPFHMAPSFRMSADANSIGPLAGSLLQASA